MKLQRPNLRPIFKMFP